MKIFCVIMILVSSLCWPGDISAMKINQPQYVGSIRRDASGGFYFKNETANYGRKSAGLGMGSLNVYDDGVVKFSDGDDALWLHFRQDSKASSEKMNVGCFGAEDGNNVVPINFYGPEIFKATTDSGITFYIIDNMYVMNGKHRQINVVGRDSDGKWKKYIDLAPIVNEYFADAEDPFYRFEVSRNKIHMYYSYWNNTEDNVYNNGEVRFTWSDDIAGFISEKITYNKN